MKVALRYVGHGRYAEAADGSIIPPRDLSPFAAKKYGLSIAEWQAKHGVVLYVPETGTIETPEPEGEEESDGLCTV